MNVIRTREEIKRVENWAYVGIDYETARPEKSYEQGIVDVLDWLQLESAPAPNVEEK